MHRDALIIVHPHYGCTYNKEMPFARNKRTLHRNQRWASENPLAERIIQEHNGRNTVYMVEALLANDRCDMVFMLDHDRFEKFKWDEFTWLRRSMDQKTACLVVDEVERIKKGLVSWFLDNFGEGHLLRIDHRNIGPYLRRKFDFPVNMHISLMGEFLDACVHEASHSLSIMSFSNVRIDEEKCVA